MTMPIFGPDSAPDPAPDLKVMDNDPGTEILPHETNKGGVRIPPAPPIYNQDPTQGNAKYDAGKLRLELLPWEALEGIGAVMTHGATKYDDDNWRKPDASWRRYLGSLTRHLSAFAQGEDIDPDSGLPHIDHIATNAVFLATFYHVGIGTDDRYRKGEVL